MPDTNDKMNELMEAFNKKLKTRRILLMSKYSDITEAPISVQDEIYTIQTLLNILEVSESDFNTEKVKSSNEIEINVTLIEEYENNLKKFDIFREMNSSDVSENDEKRYINKDKEIDNEKPINQYQERKQLIKEIYQNIENAPQSIIDEYRNLETLIKLINDSQKENIETENAEDNTKIDKNNIKIYNSILQINKTLQIINSKHLQSKPKVIDEKTERKIDEQLNSIPNDDEELKRKIKENELKIEAMTKSSKMIADIDKTININTEIKNLVNQEVKENQKEQQEEIEDTPLETIPQNEDTTNIIEAIYQAHLSNEEHKPETKADKDGIIVAKSVPVENKEAQTEEKKTQNSEKVVMAVQTLIKGQEKTLISPEYIKTIEKTELFKKSEKETEETQNTINTVKTITKKDLEEIYGQRKNEPGFYEAIEIVDETLEKNKK